MDAMKIRFAVVAMLLTLLIASAVGAAATDEQFKLDRNGWTVVGPPRSGAKINVEGELHPKPAFLITPQSEAGAWVISEPLPAMPRPATLSMRVQKRSGSGALAVSFVSDIPESPVQITPLWHLEVKDDRNHKIELGLVAHRTEALRLAIGAVGGEGQWTVEDIELSDWTALERKPGPLADLPAATSPEPLPVGWEPPDSLDGRWRTVGTEREMLTDVNGLRITFPAKVTVAQGVRHEMVVLVTNRGDVEKDLTISLQGPPGAYMPTFTVPFAAGGTTLFRPPVQMLQVGNHWIKVKLSSGSETVVVPIEVVCEPRYPTIGISLDLEPLATALPDLREIAQFLQMRMPAEFALTSTTSQQLNEVAGQVILSLPLGNDASTMLARAKATQVNWMPSLVGLYLPASMQQSSGSAIAAAVASATEQIRSESSQAAIISPPLPVVTSDEGLIPSPQFAQALDAGMGTAVGSVGLHISALPHGAVLTEKIDGRFRQQPSSFWTDFDARYDFASLRQTLTQRQLRLPLFLDRLPVRGTGEARLDALMLGRLLISGFAQGCTAATFPADLVDPVQENPLPSPVLMALQELTRELAGTVPLRGLADKEGFSGRIDEPIIYRSFMRKNEGILFMWNNTSQPIDVAVVLRALPLQMHLLRLSYSERFVERRFQGLFSLSDEARTNHQQAVYVRVQPLEIVSLSFNFKNPHAGWLGQLAPRPPVKNYGPHWPEHGGDRPWGFGNS